MENKECTKWKKDLEISLFNLRGGQLTKCCVKCLYNFKKLKQQTKCEHNNQRSHCKDCGGSEVCEHNRRRSMCKDCGGSQICVHNKRRSRCKDCGEGRICEHNKIKSQFKDCSRSQICEHNKIKYVKTVAGVIFVSTTRKDRHAPCVIPLDTLLGSYNVVFMLP